MKSYKFYLGNEEFSIKLNNENFVVVADKKKDSTNISFSINRDNGTYHVTLSDLSPHTQYLFNQGKLGVVLIAQRTTIISERTAASPPDPQSNYDKRYVARKYHPYWNAISDPMPVFSLDANYDFRTYSSGNPFNYWNSRNLSGIKYLAERHHNPDRTTGYVVYKVMLCKINTVSYGGHTYAKPSSFRGYKRSEQTITIEYSLDD